MQTNTKYTKSKTNLAMVVKIPNWPGVERGIMLVRANPASTPMLSTFCFVMIENIYVFFVENMYVIVENSYVIVENVYIFVETSLRE